MKITENSQRRLLIEDRPWFLWIMLYGLGAVAFVSALSGQVEGIVETLVVAALGAAMIWVGWRYQPYQWFEFDNEAGTFTHRTKRLTGSVVWTKPLSDIKRATDQGDWSDGTRSQRIVLLTEQGPYPLEAGFTGQDRGEIIATINSWLNVT